MKEIKSTIDANITPNGEQGITGSVLNRVLNDMVDATEGKLAQLDQEWQEIKDKNGFDVMRTMFKAFMIDRDIQTIFRPLQKVRGK